MHKVFQEIPQRILENAKCALTLANTHAVFQDPGNEHWGNMSVLSAALAGELFIKAVIATQHPLLIFQNAFEFDDSSEDEIDIERLLQKARTHDLQNLPKMLWVVSRERVPDKDSFDRIRQMRNAIQHFYHPAGIENYGEAARTASLEFLYKNVDPIINKHFGICAIEFHEDHSVGYDYVVQCLLNCGMKFSVPHDFTVTEIDIDEAVSACSIEYKEWVREKLTQRP